MNKKQKKKKGFTLIELLVIVIIIGILAALALPLYFKAMEKSRISEAATLLGAIAKAEQRYKLQDNEYTDRINNLDIDILDHTLEQIATGNSFDTKYFNFILGNESASAARKNGENYSLNINYSTNKITCIVSEESNKICQSMGFEVVETIPDPSSRAIQVTEGDIQYECYGENVSNDGTTCLHYDSYVEYNDSYSGIAIMCGSGGRLYEGDWCDDWWENSCTRFHCYGEYGGCYGDAINEQGNGCNYYNLS